MFYPRKRTPPTYQSTHEVTAAQQYLCMYVTYPPHPLTCPHLIIKKCIYEYVETHRLSFNMTILKYRMYE